MQFVENWRRFLPEATVIREVAAPESGFVTAMDGEALGLAVVELGGGRQVESDVVDPSVGFSDVVTLGQKVVKGQPLLRIHAAREEAARKAEQAVLAAIPSAIYSVMCSVIFSAAVAGAVAVVHDVAPICAITWN